MRLNNHTKGRLHEYFRYKLKAFDYRNSWMKSDCPYCGGEKSSALTFQTIGVIVSSVVSILLR